MRRWPSKYTADEISEERESATQAAEVRISHKRLRIGLWRWRKEQRRLGHSWRRFIWLRKWQLWRTANRDRWREINRRAKSKPRAMAATVKRVRALRHRRAKARPPFTCGFCGAQWCNLPIPGGSPRRWCSIRCKRAGSTLRAARASVPPGGQER